MTEKRADYRKKQQQKKIRKIFDNFKRLKKDDQQVDEVDPEPTVKESFKKALELCNFNCWCFINYSFVRFV